MAGANTQIISKGFSDRYHLPEAYSSCENFMISQPIYDSCWRSLGKYIKLDFHALMQTEGVIVAADSNEDRPTVDSTLLVDLVASALAKADVDADLIDNCLERIDHFVTVWNKYAETETD